MLAVLAFQYDLFSSDEAYLIFLAVEYHRGVLFK